MQAPADCLTGPPIQISLAGLLEVKFVRKAKVRIIPALIKQSVSKSFIIWQSHETQDE